MNMNSIEQYLAEFTSIINRISDNEILYAVDLLYDTWENKKQIFLFGNGGSASTASHMANDLSKATIISGKQRIRAISLTDCVSIITAWANDTSYDNIFKEQLSNLLQPDDLVIGISASGNSLNVVRAIEFAKQIGAMTMGWTGLSGGKLSRIVDHCLRSPTDNVGMIESTHLIFDHLITNELRIRIQMDI